MADDLSFVRGQPTVRTESRSNEARPMTAQEDSETDVAKEYVGLIVIGEFPGGPT
jgi:hypothetical protein